MDIDDFGNRLNEEIQNLIDETGGLHVRDTKVAIKAIKAKEKNKILIKDSLKIYNEDLVELIRKYGGDLEYFK